MFRGMDTPPLPLEIASGILIAAGIVYMVSYARRLWDAGDGNLAIGVWLLFGGFGAAFIMAGLGVLPW